MTQKKHPAKFIVVEGLEGAGKSTAIQTVISTLQNLGISNTLNTREPGGTPLAEQLRALVKQEHEETLTPETECLIMYAARMQLIENVIQPALQEGQWVIGDRHDLSSRAYQGGGRELKTLVDQISEATLGDFKPDLTLYLDIDPTVGLQRAVQRGELDRIEKEHLDFFVRTRNRYLELEAQDDTICLVDASLSLEEVQKQIVSILNERVSPWI